MKIKEKIKKLVVITLVGAMVCLSANSFSVHAQSISDVSVSKPGYGIVNTSDGSGVNVRNAPNTTNSDIIVSVAANTRLMIVGQSGNFYTVQYDTSGHYGYVSKDYLNFISTNYYLKANISSGNLNMRESNSASSTIIASIPKDTGFAFWSQVTGWYRGIYGNAFGYTSEDYTKLCRY